jgi:hypothetical protein
MATAARIVILLMATLAFANAQCLVSCAIQPCQAAPVSHCHQHPGKAAPTVCGHGQFARTAEVQTAPVVVAMEASPLPVVYQPFTAHSIEPVRPLKLPDLPSLQILRI